MLWKSQIGRIATAKGYVKPSDVADAVDAQDLGIEKPLGRILLQLGALTEDQLNDVIDARDSESPDWKEAPRIRLENLLFATAGLHKGLLSDVDVAIALKKAEASTPSSSLAAALKASGTLNGEQFDEILRLRNREDLICSLCRHMSIPTDVLKEGALPVCDRCGGEYRIVDSPLVEAPTLTKKVVKKAETQVEKKPKVRRKSTGMQAVAPEKPAKPPAPVSPPAEATPAPVPLPSVESTPAPEATKVSSTDPVEAPVEAGPRLETGETGTVEEATPPVQEKAPPPVPRAEEIPSAKATEASALSAEDPTPPATVEKEEEVIPLENLADLDEAPAPLPESPPEGTPPEEREAVSPTEFRSVLREIELEETEEAPPEREAVKEETDEAPPRPPEPRPTPGKAPARVPRPKVERRAKRAEAALPRAPRRKGRMVAVFIVVALLVALGAVATPIVLKQMEGGPKTSSPSSSPSPTPSTPSPATTKGETPETPPPDPRLEVTAPEGSGLLKERRITVQGRCNPAAVTSVTVGGETVALGDSGSFRRDVDLLEGENNLSVVAKNGEEVLDKQTFLVVVDSLSPRIEVEGFPASGRRLTKEHRLDLRGKAEDAHPGRVTVDGTNRPMDEQGRFRAGVSLDEGENRVPIHAVDRAGNESSRTLVIVKDTTPPAIRMEPFPGEVRSADPSISLAGSIVEEHLDSLRVGSRSIPVIEGRFKAPLRLEEGRNLFTLKARDRLGWEAGKEIEIRFFRIPRGLVSVEGSQEFLCKRDAARMVLVPGGPFRRGSKTGRPDEAPPGDVEISPFYMDTTEVTNRLYGKFLAWMKTASDPHKYCHPEEPKNKDHTPRFWKDPKWNGPYHPVVGVDWFDAYAYARWAGKRLPTEAEWEKAASWHLESGTSRTYPWGEDPPNGTRCNFGNAFKASKPVGDFEGDRSPSGLLDMAGNVREWCLDWYEKGFYARTRASGSDPKNLYPPKKRFRVLRGGAWNDAASHLRTRARGYLPPRAFSPAIGFRCVLSEKR